jgi:2,3-dihydroxybenzoate decarboxylase
LRVNFIYTNSGVGWGPPVQFIREVIGPDRMLYAMDYPWQFVPEEVGTLEAMGLDAAGLKQFFEDNARRVFRL